jgi:hypothetical protein
MSVRNDVQDLVDAVQTANNEVRENPSTEKAIHVCRTVRALAAAVDDEIIWHEGAEEKLIELSLQEVTKSLAILKDLSESRIEIPAYVIENVERRKQRLTNPTYEQVIARLENYR